MNLASIKRHPVFALVLAVIALLLIGTGAGLYFSAREYYRQAKALDTVMNRLQQLYRRDPFPAAENVRKEADNLKDVVDQYNELNEILRAGQIDPQPMKAADFMPFRERTLRKLRSTLQNARIKIPDKYAFGFDKYEGGLMPASADIPRLVQQLNIIVELCDIMRDAGVTELVSIERESFEDAASGADVSGGRREAAAPEAAPGAAKLFSSQHFKLTFKARENALTKMLNLLANRPIFTAVTQLDITNPRQDYNIGGPTPSAAATPDAARERAIILGREELDIKLEVDVYEFAPSLNVNEGGKG